MQNKLQLITDLSQHTAQKITRNYENWTAFLKTAAWNYKYPFQDQLLIYAQRPDATACAPIEVWNTRLSRWVRAGSKGIALIDDSTNQLKLKYVFDVSDTYGHNNRPALWSYQDEYKLAVSEMLAEEFDGLQVNNGLPTLLLDAAVQTVNDSEGDALTDLLLVRDSSLLEELDDLNVEAFFKESVKSAVAFMLFVRCGIPTDIFFIPEDFKYIPSFNTLDTVARLGAEISSTAESLLRSIERTIKAAQKDKQQSQQLAINSPLIQNNERDTENERIEHDDSRVQTAGRLSDTGTGAAARGASVGQVRNATQDLPEGAQAGDIRQPDVVGQLEQPLGGNRQDREGTDRVDYDRSVESTTGTGQSKRPDGLGRTHEQPQTFRGGNGDDGVNIQLSLFPTVQEQIARIEKTESVKPHFVFSFKQSEIDLVLQSGSNQKDSKLRICAEFQKGKSNTEIAEFLREEYYGGKGFLVGYGDLSAWFSEDGIHLSQGTSARRIDIAQILSWEDTAERIRGLLEQGQYMTKNELAQVDVYERTKLAGTLWYLHQDRVESFFMEEIFKGGFPDSTARIADLLSQPDSRREIVEALQDFSSSYEKDKSLLRFNWHNPNQLLAHIKELDLPRIKYSTELNEVPHVNMFITQDEINASLTGGSSVEGGKGRIYSYFREQHTLKEKADFLKNEYGIGGHSHALSGADSSSESHDAKGIQFKKGGCADVMLTWSAVAKDISFLFLLNEYLTPEEQQKVKGLSVYTPRHKATPPEYEDSDEDDIEYDDETLEDEQPSLPLELDIAADKASPITLGHSPVKVRLPYAVGDAVFLDNASFIIKEVNDHTVQLQDSNLIYPVFRTESRENFERLLLRDKRNAPLVDFLQADLDKTNTDLHEVLVSGLLTQEHKVVISRMFHDNVGNSEVAVKLAEIVPTDVQSMSLVTGESVDIITSEHGLKVEIQDKYRTRLSVSWAEVSPILRALYSKEQDGFTHPQSDSVPDAIPIPANRNFYITDDHLGKGGPKEKYRWNIEAINTLQSIEADGRMASSDEQEVLSKYVGWGGLPQAFDEENRQWAKEYTELKALLTDGEYAMARASTLNAHYTSPTVIKAIYTCIESMGFHNGNILEPSMGIGNFFGLLPESMSVSNLYGVELDSVTGRIAKQLYPRADIAIQGFETTNHPDSFFGLVIGNVPFGNYGVSDRKYDKYHFLIHDYFFAKALDKACPGGLVVFITSKGTMDKQNPSVRKYIAQRAELLGAIRLPNTAFHENAGTEVTADILFLQKRDRVIDIEPDWVHLGMTEDNVPVNNYFVDHPHMILGRMAFQDTMYGAESDTTCQPVEGTDLAQQLGDAIKHIHADVPEYTVDEAAEGKDVSIPADPTVRNFSFTLHEGSIYYRENGRMNKVDVGITATERIKGLIEIRECVRTLIDYQTDDYPDEAIREQQQKLNALYDHFTAKYGLISGRANNMAFSDDSSYFLLCSLEILDEEGNLKQKADMFTKRTIRRQVSVTHVDTASEALGVCIGEKACVDLPYMQSLTGLTEEQIISDLKGVIFRNLGDGDPAQVPKAFIQLTDFPYVPADEYLSGNVRNKLRMATGLAEMRPDFAELIAPNISALEAVQPKDLGASEIDVRLGATWVPCDVVKEFIFSLLNTSPVARKVIEVFYSEHTSNWNIRGKSSEQTNIKVNVAYGTKRINAYYIIENTLNLRDVRIFDTVMEDGKETRVFNAKETAIAQQKQETIKEAFKDWIWRDQKRRECLVCLYNDRFNSVRPREYDGSHIKFTGMNPEIKLREHQVNAVARGIYGGNTLLAHCVGAGKTYEMTAIAMECKHLGLCTKSIFAVPNHLTEQWASEFLQLYPSANILVSTKKDFETGNRKRFCARIATGDYDAIIIGQSQFEKIPISPERQKRLLEEQIDEITNGVSDLKSQNGERFAIKQLEQMKKGLQLKLDKLNNNDRKDDVVTFEELGVDRLFADEADYYKNLFLYTKMRNVAGIGQSDAQKASDMFSKCRYLDELTGGRGIIFATGTPVSNSIVELYTMQRYLQYDLLVKNQLTHFDCWASTFGETVTAIELAPEGTGYRAKTRFAKFYNLPELMSMFQEVADIQTADMLNLPVPKANFINVAVKPSEIQQEMVKQLADRAEAVRKRLVTPHEDNMLKITNDGRKLALDQRLINELLPDDISSKVSACADNVYHLWMDYSNNKATQLVFCDLSTPKNDGTFNVYDDLRQKLISRGVPEQEIAFIHDAKTDAAKKELFSKVRTGQIRVLIGSTAKMGAGTNVQDRLIAGHHLDCPWRPRDLEQRDGRTIRQGNQNAEVFIHKYVTENTFDAYLYQILENKQKFISQIMTSKSPVRSAEDIDETALSYAEVKALATGNPYIKEKMDLDIQVTKLKMLRANHLSQRYSLEDKLIKYYPQEQKKLQEYISGYEKDIALCRQQLEAAPPKDDEEAKFAGMTVQGRFFSEKAKAGFALLEACKQMDSLSTEEIGSYIGFPMFLSFNSFYNQHELILRGAISHKAVLGTDIYGNITRINNVLADMPENLRFCNEKLETLYQEIEEAKEQVTQPFEKEQELQTKSARLAELNILLNMDKSENENVECEVEEVDSTKIVSDKPIQNNPSSPVMM